jgi:agmatinase
MQSRKTVLPDPRRTPRFSGLCTFCRYPRLEEVAPENAPVDWAVYGVPFDGGVTYRPGARFGPRAIRVESQYVKGYSVEHGVDVPGTLSVADAGDAPVEPYSLKGTLDAVRAFAAGLGDPKSTRLLAVGGDHSVAYANIAATWERRGRPRGGLALLHFDSHLDTVDRVFGEKWGHASPLVRAIEDGFIDPRRMLSVGIKGPLNAAGDLEFAKEHGITLMTYDQWRRAKPEGIDEVATFARELGPAEAYLTFDIDCVDPAFAPGTGTPSIGGFTSADALSLLRSLRGANIVGADVVEVLPDRDVGGITALLAAHVIFEILALDAVRQRESRPVEGAQKPGAAEARKPARRR